MMNIKINDNTKSFTFFDKQVKVLQYLDVRSHASLINIAMQKAQTPNGYDSVLLEAYFKACAAYLLTDMDFTDEDKANSLDTYDVLESNGFFDLMIETYGEEKWNDLMTDMYDALYHARQERNSVAGIVNDFINSMPKNAEAAMNILNAMDTEKFENITRLANATSGGKPING